MNRNESHVTVIEDHGVVRFKEEFMSITAIGSPAVPSAADQKRFQYPDQFGKNSGLSGRQSSVSAKMVSEYYSSQSISVEYTSKDGDTVSFSMESVKYAKSSMELSATGNKDDMKALVDYIKDNFDQMRKDIIRGFLKSVGVDVPENEDVEKVEETETLQIPEEWNAENTSQRIVDFAVSFFDAFEGAGDEFLSTIKDAVEEGFKQAREMLGELPGQVSSLIDDTYELVMEKLDAWGVEQGITAQEQEQAA